MPELKAEFPEQHQQQPRAHEAFPLEVISRAIARLPQRTIQIIS